MKKKIMMLVLIILGMNIFIPTVSAININEKIYLTNSFKLADSKEKNSKKIKKKNKKKKSKSSNLKKAQKYNKKTEVERAENTKGDGSYQVGIDIPAGEYVIVIGDKDLDGRKGYYMGSLKIYSDNSESEEIETIVVQLDKKGLSTDGIFSKAKFKESELSIFNSILVELKDGQFIKVDNVKIHPAELREKPNLDKIVEGYYQVGRDLPVGKYKITEQNQANETLHSVWIYKTVDPTVAVEDSTIKIYQDYSDETYPDEITLEEGTYIYFSDLILTKK